MYVARKATWNETYFLSEDSFRKERDGSAKFAYFKLSTFLYL